MNNTLATVLITIAAVQTVNFIALFVDESVFYRKYEDWGKRICCLFPFLLVNLILFPATLYRKSLRRRQRQRKIEREDRVTQLYRHIVDSPEFKWFETSESGEKKFPLRPEDPDEVFDDLAKKFGWYPDYMAKWERFDDGDGEGDYVVLTITKVGKDGK